MPTRNRQIYKVFSSYMVATKTCRCPTVLFTVTHHINQSQVTKLEVLTTTISFSGAEI